jgi:hypothetical protein
LQKTLPFDRNESFSVAEPVFFPSQYFSEDWQYLHDLFMMTPGFVTERIVSFTGSKHHSSQTSTATMHDS